MCINSAALVAPNASTHTHTHTTGAYVVQPASEACSSDTILGSFSECSGAKAVLDAAAPAVEIEEDYASAPKGCSRHKGKWYFNTHATGSLDRVSEPVCQAVYGNAIKCITCPVSCLFSLLHTLFSHTSGDWAQEEAHGCARECGVGLGLSGTPGLVKCSTSSCDPETKPSAKQCPKTVDCGTCLLCYFDCCIHLLLMLPSQCFVLRVV